MVIYSVTDPEFIPYGKVLEGYDTSELLSVMQAFPFPDAGTAYLPSIEELERLDIFADLRDRAYGGMPIQLGMCWGHNSKLNALEYHRDSEINIGASDMVLLLAKLDDLKNNILDTAKVKAFRVPAGVPVEMYATTLHYAPCDVPEADGFRSAVALPLGTNLDLPAFTPKCAEDHWMTARNKWLLAHPDSEEAKSGAYIGLSGTNIDISE